MNEKHKDKIREENLKLKKALVDIARLHEDYEDACSNVRSSLLYDARCIARSNLEKYETK